MNFGKWAGEVQRTVGGVINLALIPVRLPGAVTCFAWQTISHWWSERRERKRGRVANIGSLPDSGSWLPNGAEHH